MSLELTPEQVSQAKSLLAVLQKKFPHTFATASRQMKPLKINIHKDVHRALEQQYSHKAINHALRLYTEDSSYFKTLVVGTQRIDLAGQICGEVTAAHVEIAQKVAIRQKRRNEQAQNHSSSTVASPQTVEQRPTLSLKKKISACKPGNLFKVIWRPKKSDAEAASQKPALLQPSQKVEATPISGKLEINIKLTALPEKTQTVKNGWQQFVVETGRYKIKLTIRPRTWRKLQQSAASYSSWIAFITGKIGSRMKGGFEMTEPAIQIFECKNKSSG